jgi:hypothetical protein
MIIRGILYVVVVLAAIYLLIHSFNTNLFGTPWIPIVLFIALICLIIYLIQRKFGNRL